MIATELTALEALSVAVRREMDTQQIFCDLAATCSSPLPRERTRLRAAPHAAGRGVRLVPQYPNAYDDQETP